MKQKKSIKPLKILFKYKITIKWPKNAIIILAMIFHDFPVRGSGGARVRPPRTLYVYSFWAPIRNYNTILKHLEMWISKAPDPQCRGKWQSSVNKTCLTKKSPMGSSGLQWGLQWGEIGENNFGVFLLFS